MRRIGIEAWKGRMIIEGNSHEIVHNADLDLTATCVPGIIVKDLSVPAHIQDACCRSRMALL